MRCDALLKEPRPRHSARRKKTKMMDDGNEEAKGEGRRRRVMESGERKERTERKKAANLTVLTEKSLFLFQTDRDERTVLPSVLPLVVVTPFLSSSAICSGRRKIQDEKERSYPILHLWASQPMQKVREARKERRRWRTRTRFES